MSTIQEDAWHELWGTFSVRDHTRRGAFIAEVLVYDRLIVPVLPTADDLKKDAETRGEHISAKELAAKERQRWIDAGWDPDRQRELTDILRRKDRVDLVPWTRAREAEWHAEMKRGFDAARRDGYFMTGTVLQRFAPVMAKAVVAVAQYHSLKELQEKEGIRRRVPHERLPSSTLLAILGHELLLPGDPEEDNFRHLEEALDVAGDPKYRLARRNLYEWQQQFIRGEETDEPSVARAVNHMAHLVHELRTATTQQSRWTWAKRFFNFISIGSKAAAIGGPIMAPVVAGGNTVAAAGTFVVDELAPKLPPGIPAATLVLDAQSKLGIE